MPQGVLLPVIWGLICMCLTLKYNGKFSKPLYLYLLFYFFSAVSCWYFEGQTIRETFTGADSLQFFPVVVYFILLKNRCDLTGILKSINIAYILFTVCFIIQLAALPKPLFHLATNYCEIGRFTMSGQSIAYLSMFHFYNKYLLKTEKKYLVYMIPAVLTMFVAGFRTQMAVSFLCFLLMTYQIQKKSSLKYYIVLAAIAAILLQIPIVQNQINNMFERQASGASYENEDYIRIVQYEYFTKHHFKSWIEYFLGSGIPNPGTKYGEPFYYIDPLVGPYNGWRDWGIIGLSWVIGIPAVLCLLLPAINLSWKIKNNDFLFIRYYYVFVILSGFTTVEFYRYGSFFLHGLLFYMYEKISDTEEIYHYQTK